MKISEAFSLSVSKYLIEELDKKEISIDDEDVKIRLYGLILESLDTALLKSYDDTIEAFKQQKTKSFN